MLGVDGVASATAAGASVDAFEKTRGARETAARTISIRATVPRTQKAARMVRLGRLRVNPEFDSDGIRDCECSCPFPKGKRRKE